jgi:hypothetical protein
MSKLDDKIIDGYSYRNTPFDASSEESQLRIVTGSSGARLMIEEFRALGFPDELIEVVIQVYFEGKWILLSDLTIKDNKTE